MKVPELDLIFAKPICERHAYEQEIPFLGRTLHLLRPIQHLPPMVLRS